MHIEFPSICTTLFFHVINTSFGAPVAQLDRVLATNQGVGGSNPAGRQLIFEHAISEMSVQPKRKSDPATSRCKAALMVHQAAFCFVWCKADRRQPGSAPRQSVHRGQRDAALTISRRAWPAQPSDFSPELVRQMRCVLGSKREVPNAE